MVFLQLPEQAVRNRYNCFVDEVIVCILFVSPVCENMKLGITKYPLKRETAASRNETAVSILCDVILFQRFLAGGHEVFQKFAGAEDGNRRLGIVLLIPRHDTVNRGSFRGLDHNSILKVGNI